MYDLMGKDAVLFQYAAEDPESTDAQHVSQGAALVRLRLVNHRLRVASTTTAGAGTLADVLAGVRAILLDFDGPVCNVYAGYPAAEVARQVSDALGADEPDDVTDPLTILRRAADSSEQPQALQADSVLRAAELVAVGTSTPTPGAADFLAACPGTGIRLAIVSNNSEPAIRRYLELHDLHRYIYAITGRPAGRPELMKPSPHLLLKAIDALAVSPADTVLIGDSTTDMEAATRGDVRAVGYANKPGKFARLTAAGASIVVDDMQGLARAIVTRAAW
jgi:HAD superfamily hydrolase (TIGR01549 family)